MDDPSILSKKSLADFMGAVTSKFGVESADRQKSVDETVGSFLEDIGVEASVRASKWGKIVIEVKDGPSAAAVKYCLSDLSERLEAAGFNSQVSVRIAAA